MEYKFEKASPTSVDIYILDAIGDWIDDYWGFGTTAKSFIEELNALPEDVTSIRVLLNSPGGSAFAGITIANALRQQHAERGRSVETMVLGVAASAASMILMAGQEVSVVDNAVVMIHNPWVLAIGGAKEMRQTADRLDTIRDAAVSTYRWHSSLSKAEIIQLMDDETYLSADEAVAKGFATRKVSGKKGIAKTFPAKTIAELKLPHRFADLAKELTAPRRTFEIVKTDPHKRQCFGWASVAVCVEGKEIVDAHEHIIEPEELEQAAYQFNLHHRDMDENHTEPVKGQLIESLVVTPEKLRAMGLPANSLPQGWWVGFQVDDDAFQKVLSGEYRMFSIAGTARPEDIK